MKKAFKSIILAVCIFLISINAYSVLGETNEEFVESLYNNILGRSSDPDGLQDHLNALNSGELSREQIISNFFNSEEYQNKNNGDSEFVEDLYRAILRREPDLNGLDHNQDLLNRRQVTREEMINGFMDSPEYQERIRGTTQNVENTQQTTSSETGQTFLGSIIGFLTRLYNGVLGREPDTQGFQHNLNLLNSGQRTREEMAHSFLNSPEYGSKSNEEFLRDLYRGVLGREPEQAGFQHNLNLLNTGQISRDQMIYAFINSPEFQETSQDEVQIAEGILDSMCISDTIPDQMIAGETRTVALTIMNTGTAVWTQANGFKIGTTSPLDNFIFGIARVNVPNDVAPQQEVTFTFDITAPSTPGIYQNDWETLKEGTARFGDVCNNIINVVAGAVPPTSQPSPPSPPTPPGPTQPADQLISSVSITADKTSGEVPLEVKFDVVVAGGDAPFTYAWDFNNDGNIDSTIKSPKAIFTEEGNYLVRVAVTDSDGDAATATITINANERHIRLARKKIHMDSISFENDEIKAGENLAVYVNFENQGNYKINGDASVTLIVPDLALRQKINIDLKKGKGVTKKFIFEIPEDAEPGIYDVMVVIYDNGLKRIRYRPIEII